MGDRPIDRWRITESIDGARSNRSIASIDSIDHGRGRSIDRSIASIDRALDVARAIDDGRARRVRVRVRLRVRVRVDVDDDGVIVAKRITSDERE